MVYLVFAFEFGWLGWWLLGGLLMVLYIHVLLRWCAVSDGKMR
jgi:hypothetical protein